MVARNLKIAKFPVRQPKGRGAQFVHAALRARILRMELRPGAKLDEAGLVQAFGVSRTPVREALIRLAAERLVFLLPNQGAQVAPLDLVETAQYFEAFDLMQRTVNHWAALRRTGSDLAAIERARDAFDRAVRREDPEGIVSSNFDLHTAIAAAARNTHIEATLRRLLEHGMRLCWLWYTDFAQEIVRRDMSNSCTEHHDIVEAIRAQDARRADTLGHLHTESFRARLKEHLDANLAPQIELASD
jgi:DNA-binding GntR family transcriptional regulator